MTKEEIVSKITEIFNELNLTSVTYLCAHCIPINTELNHYRIDIDIEDVELAYEYPVGILSPKAGLEPDGLKHFLILNNIKIEDLNRVHEKMIQLVEEVSLDYNGTWFSVKCKLKKK